MKHLLNFGLKTHVSLDYEMYSFLEYFKEISNLAFLADFSTVRSLYLQEGDMGRSIAIKYFSKASLDKKQIYRALP